MGADRADLGSLLANHNVAAVTALPDLHFALGKDFLHFHIVQQGTVTLLMVLLNSGNATEFGSQLREAFRVRSLGKLST